MSSEAWVGIITAIISVLGTLITTKFDSIVDTLKKSPRKIAGTWEGVSYRINNDPNIQSEKIEECRQIVEISQNGIRVKAKMTQTKARQLNHKLLTFDWIGKIEGDYLKYEANAQGDNFFLISNALLYIHPGGDKMYGYFVANGGKNDPKRTWVGYTEMIRR